MLDYVVNGRPALEWIMKWQIVTTDKNSHNVNELNRYPIKTVKSFSHYLEFFQIIITVSLEIINKRQ